MGKFEIKKEGLFVNGEKTKIVSGAMHYFRIFPEYWSDRLLKLKELGCNCVETYIAWHLHEKTEGDFRTDGRLDFVKYIEEAQKLGLYVILRPGPYICSECDLGGFPWWLLKYDGMELRTYNKLYLSKVETYIKRVCDLIRPKLITNGGNVILVQIENEFGSYGFDKAYLNEIVRFYREGGIDVPFITSDGDERFMLEAGTVDGVYASVNYRWDSVRAAGKLKEFQPDLPAANMELWNGMAIHNGERMVPRDLKEVEYSVKSALENMDLINLYMFHGGTNFGFMNGALYLYGRGLVEQATSYDVQAPVSECGKKTEKYYAEQKIICEYSGKPIENTAPDPVMTDYGEAKAAGVMPLSKLDKKFYSVKMSDKLLSMEQCDQGYGYIEYKTNINVGKLGCILKYPIIHDRAILYVDGKYRKFLLCDQESNCDIPFAGKHEIKFFVENAGRVNYGQHLFDRKGLLGEAVIFDKETQSYKTLDNWTITSYPFDGAEVVDSGEYAINGQNLFKYEIELKPEGDTYLEVKGFYRGFVMINGFNLGRHVACGPQRSLFVPKSLLKEGKNEIIVFDFKTDDKEKKVLLHGRQILDGYTE